MLQLRREGVGSWIIFAHLRNPTCTVRRNEGIKAITEEWQEAYTESTMNWSSSSKPLVTAAMIEKVNYVLNEAAEDCCVTGNDGKDAQQDKGHSNWFLQDFCAQPQVPVLQHVLFVLHCLANPLEYCQKRREKSACWPVGS